MNDRPFVTRGGEVLNKARAALAGQFGNNVIFDLDRMATYARDQCLVARAGQPMAVLRARSSGDVVNAMRIANLFRIPVVTRGAGTGLSGAANAVDHCLVIGLDLMDAVVSIDTDERLATVEPGVINADLDRAAAKHELQYMPDPGSRAISSIGGNIATNAGGMCCAKYGVTGDHVAALKVVLPSGDLIQTGATTRKNVTGLDLTKLLVGSEGTLGIIVEATVRLQPRKIGQATVIATFGTVASAMQAVLLITSRTSPSALEIMDATTIKAVNEFTQMGIDAESGAVLLTTYDGRDASAEAAACESIATQAGAREAFRTDDADEGAMLMAARRAALPALEKLGSTLLDDVAVPLKSLPDMVMAIQQQSRTQGLVIGTFGHAADGNLHPTIVFDAQDPDQRARAQDAFHEIVKAALRLGGTVSGEHGIGSLKRSYVEQMYGPTEVALMSRIRAAFDPYGLMNPGKGY